MRKTPQNIQTSTLRSRVRNFFLLSDPAVWEEYSKFSNGGTMKIRLRGYKEDYRIPRKAKLVR